MKTNCPIVSILLVFMICTSAWGTCPQDSVDLGICDTLHVQCLDCASVSGSPPWNVHLMLLSTHDLTETIDSLKGFDIPLTYSGDGDFLADSNTNDLSGAGLSSSIFRDFGGAENRMLDLEQLGGGQSWDTRTIQVDTSLNQFFISLSASAASDQKWWEGSRVLLATLTMTVTDTCRIDIDTTYWAKGTRFSCTRTDDKSYIPRPKYSSCFYVGIKAGDANCDGHRGLGDIVCLLNYVFKNGPAPRFLWVGDVNNDQTVTVADIVILINYLCKGGPAPVESCTLGG